MILQRLVAVILLLYQGVHECLNECSDFESFERRVRGWLAETGREILSIVLEDLDAKLMREKGPNETRFLLDERLGLEERDRVSAGLKELAVRLGTELSFRKAAEVLREITPGISPMTAWNIVKEAGEQAKAEGERLREQVFERGEDPGGKEKAERLHIEADGVVIALQRSKKRREEVKIGAAYEGKESDGKRVRLKGRRIIAGVMSEEAFWEETTARVGERWDLGGVRGVIVGGDGAPWVKKGTEYFENAEYRLDKFHLRRALREALGHDPEGYEETRKAILGRDLNRVKECLKEAERRSTGSKRQGVVRLRRYLLDNWDGIKSSDEVESLGAIEGEGYHQVARRMKRMGASWSEHGADRMARLLAAKANGELNRYTGSWRIPWKSVPLVLPRLEQFNAADLDAKAEEVGAWLRARVPALTGPYQSSLFVKYVLRQIVLGSREGI